MIWPISIALFLFALSFGAFAIQSGDVMMYLALVRDFLASGKWFESKDPYLYSLDAARLVWQHEYLSYLYFNELHTILGPAGLIAAKLILLSFIFVLVLRAKPVEQNKNLLWMFLWTLAVLAGSFRFIERSSLFSDLFCVGLSAFLVDREKLEWRDVIALTLIFLFWVQLHPGYPLGVVLLLLWVTHRWLITKTISWKEGLISILPLAALILNPLGVEGALYPIQFAFNEARTLKLFNFEWMPSYHPSFRFAHEVLAFWILGSVALFFIIKEKLSLELRGWFAILALITATQTVRFIPWAVFASILLLKPWLSFKAKHLANSYVAATFSLVLIVIATKNLSFGYESSSGKRLAQWDWDPKFFPSKTLTFLKANRIPGRVYNTHDFGSILVWEGLYPIFHHGFVTDMSFYAGDVMGVFESQKRFLELARKYNWTMLLVEKYGAYAYFHKILSPLPEWKIVAEDDASYLIYLLPQQP